MRPPKSPFCPERDRLSHFSVLRSHVSYGYYRTCRALRKSYEDFTRASASGFGPRLASIYEPVLGGNDKRAE